jgi:hypothetical protein
MNLSVVAVTILGTFCRTAVRPPLAYNPAVVFTLNQDTGKWWRSGVRARG